MQKEWQCSGHMFIYISRLASRFSYTELLSKNGDFLAFSFTARAVAPHRGMSNGGSLEGGSSGASCSSLYCGGSAALLWNG